MNIFKKDLRVIPFNIILFLLLLWGKVIGAYAASAPIALSGCDETALRNAAAVGGDYRLTCEGIVYLSQPILVKSNLYLEAVSNTVIISGSDAVRHFEVSSNVSLTLVNLTLANGYATEGGGSISNGGTLIVLGSTFVSNKVVSTAEVANGGAILNSRILKATNCTFYRNSVVNNRGLNSYAGGGAVSGGTNAKIASCTFVENSCRGGFAGGGA